MTSAFKNPFVLHLFFLPRKSRTWRKKKKKKEMITGDILGYMCSFPNKRTPNQECNGKRWKELGPACLPALCRTDTPLISP
jgi:hypothetical protein